MLYTLKRGDDCSEEQYVDLRRDHKLDGVFSTAHDIVDDYEATHASARVKSFEMLVHPDGRVMGKMTAHEATRC